jgi:general secretion pathway protein G
MNTFYNDIAAIRRTRSNERGFTLIELLVVIAIVAAIPELLIPAIQSAREAYAANDAASNLNQLSVASTEYRNRTGSYPDSLDDLIGWNFTPLDPQVVEQGKKNGYLYEIVESDQDQCRIESKPESPGITGSLILGVIVTWNNSRTYQIISAGADKERELMLNNIRSKAAETVVRLLNLDNSAVSQVRGYVESPDASNRLFDTLVGNDNREVSVELMLSCASGMHLDAELRSPFEEFIAYVAEQMKLDSLSDEAKRSIAVGTGDLEQGQQPPLFSYDGLCILTQSWINQPDISNPLCANLEAAEAAETSGDLSRRDRVIMSFKRQVNSQIGQAISGGDAKRLITLAGAMASEE